MTTTLVADPAVDGAALERIGVALADGVRRRILMALLDGPAVPSDLASRLGTSRSNLSNHLSCLRGCGLIEARRDGRNLYYRMTSEDLASAMRALIACACSLPECQEQQP